MSSRISSTCCARGLGARAVELIAARVDGVDQRIVIGASRATRDAVHLTRMFALRIERLDSSLSIEAMRIGATALGTMLAGGEGRT